MNILVSAIGSMSSDAVIYSLRKLPEVNIIGCDIYPAQWIPASVDVDGFYQIPKATHETYISELKKICIKNEIEYIIPLTDPEVDELIKNTEAFNRIGVTVCISNKGAIEISRNKLKMHDFFLGSDLIKTIPTFNFEQLKKSLFKKPVIAKIVNGRSSEGLQILQNYNELENKDYSQYIFQPFIKGEIFSVDYIQDQYGNAFSIARKELIRTKNGAGLSVEISDNERLNKMTDKIGKQLKILGCINVEFLFDGTDYFLMDINPRFSAGLAFSQLTGYNFVKNNLNFFSGKIIDKPVPISKKIICKKYIEMIMY